MRRTACVTVQQLTMVCGRGGRELTIGGEFVLIGRAIASVVGSSDVAVVVVHAVRGRCVLRWEILVRILNGVTED